MSISSMTNVALLRRTDINPQANVYSLRGIEQASAAAASSQSDVTAAMKAIFIASTVLEFA